VPIAPFTIHGNDDLDIPIDFPARLLLLTTSTAVE